MQCYLPNMKRLSIEGVFRYPGGKYNARKKIIEHFPQGLTELVSPFLGAGHIELHLTGLGVHVYGSDAFEPLVNIWSHLLTAPDELAQLCKEQFIFHDRDGFNNIMRSVIDGEYHFDSELERAAIYVCILNSSFSSMGLRVPSIRNYFMEGDTARYLHIDRKARDMVPIKRITNFYNPRIEVNCEDFEVALDKHPSVFAYLDPPYPVKSGFYGHTNEYHEAFDHGRLSRILHNRDRWRCSYNDHEMIRDLYAGHKIIPVNWFNSMKKKHNTEILIFSQD